MQKRPAQCLGGFDGPVHNAVHNGVHGVSGFWVEWFVFMVKKYLSIWSLRIFFFLLYRFALELVFAKSRWEVGMCLFNSLLYLKVFSHFGHFCSTFAGLGLCVLIFLTRLDGRQESGRGSTWRRPRSCQTLPTRCRCLILPLSGRPDLPEGFGSMMSQLSQFFGN